MYVMPLSDSIGTVLGAKIVYSDVTRYKRLQEELQQLQIELETANEELQSANAELKTTNEELQSAIEELETTNEELQSTNEELETMNEELQSTNEELEATNEQLRQRGAELDQVNEFMNFILASLRDGVIVVDRELRVHAWNKRAEDLWGLLRACLSGDLPIAETVLDAVNRPGKPIKIRVICTPRHASSDAQRGVILTLQEVRDSSA